MNQLIDLEFYNHIKEILTTARNRVYHTANSAMVRAYWEIGKSIVLRSKAVNSGQNMAPSLSKSCQNK